MRILMRSLTGTFVLILFVGVAALGAEPATPIGDEPVVVSGTLECLADTPPADAGEVTGIHVHRWDASDPRLEGEADYAGTWRVYDIPAEDSGVPADQESAIYSIVNEGGSWLCEESRLEPPPATGERGTLVFEGQGDYAGLTAYLQVDWSQAPYVFTGPPGPGRHWRPGPGTSDGPRRRGHAAPARRDTWHGSGKVSVTDILFHQPRSVGPAQDSIKGKDSGYGIAATHHGGPPHRHGGRFARRRRIRVHPGPEWLGGAPGLQ
jgi:hypothetical protein